MLRTALESHPGIRCQAEPFNSDSPSLPYDLDTPVERILERWVYGPDTERFDAVGFVLHIYHPMGLEAFPGIRENPAWQGIWPTLARMPGLKVIMLERENLLHRHLSHVLARKTSYWHSWNADRVDAVTHLGDRAPPRAQIGSQRPPVAPVVLSPETLRVDFEDIEALRRRALDVLGAHPTLTLRYEQMCAEPEAAFAAVQRFLGVEPTPLETGLRRLEQRPLDQAIANYAQLARDFASTKWSSFFDEEPA